MNEPVFRKGTLDNLDEIFNFVQAAISKMISQQIFQWDELYPLKDDFKQDIENGHLTCGYIDSKIACIYVINSLYDEEYNHAEWKYTGSKFRILHRIVVNPEFQNQGIGKITMIHLMEELKKQGIESLRLDVFSQNPYSQKLYKKLGFERTGQAQWRKGLFYLMEKVL